MDSTIVDRRVVPIGNLLQQSSDLDKCLLVSLARCPKQRLIQTDASSLPLD